MSKLMNIQVTDEHQKLIQNIDKALEQVFTQNPFFTRIDISEIVDAVNVFAASLPEGILAGIERGYNADYKNQIDPSLIYEGYLLDVADVIESVFKLQHVYDVLTFNQNIMNFFDNFTALKTHCNRYDENYGQWVEYDSFRILV